VSSSSVAKEYLDIFICIFPLALNTLHALLPRKALPHEEERRERGEERREERRGERERAMCKDEFCN